MRIDEQLCREAVRQGKTIGIIATLPATMEPARKNQVVFAEFDSDLVLKKR